MTTKEEQPGAQPGDSWKIKLTATKLILCAALFFVLFDNFAFFHNVLHVYPLTLKNFWFLASLAVTLTASILLLFTLLSSKHTTKPILIIFLLLSSAAAYFMNNYNVVIDHTMLQNIMQTDLAESADLFSRKLLYYCLLLGVLPALLVYKVELVATSWQKAALAKARDTALALLIILAMALIFSKSYTSFLREHKLLRYYTNPTYYVYSVAKYLNKTFAHSEIVVSSLGADAQIPLSDLDRELIILVVGEAARADRFSLNGYSRETNPLLQQENVVSYTNMHSCGTSTAYSVPCMFSILPRDTYSDSKGAATENLLDVLNHAGINVLWRDNNSDSKGVARRFPHQDYKNPEVNPICDIECRDEGMLVGLQEHIDGQKEGDILIVLHQMGNHGPTYYKRYPASFEVFTPTCRTNQLNECTEEEIGNAYDNALLYTDFFLSQVIKLLKQNSSNFEAAMVYMSDHGESLGEYGVYLHGLPYIMAPESQKHIASVLWFSNSFKIDEKSLRQKSTQPFSHDNLFHTVLGLMEVETSIYDKSLDII
ncbi:MAG: phosphoethanolamine--lipid A transferase, partial [Desulfobulbaceae bacterium]|nr:phosphoethanolamine--lipid A transferase [Desulfobulbaceae bacterium]